MFCRRTKRGREKLSVRLWKQSRRSKACGSPREFIILDITGGALDDKAPPFPYLEAPMKNVAVGLRVHSGWAALVAVTLEKSQPVVLRRERVQLVETFTYQFRQPYHTAEKMPFEKGREFISQ